MPKRMKEHKSALLEELRSDHVFVAEYLSAAIQDSNEMFLVALRNVGEAYGMANVAEKAQLTREALYRTLSIEGNPRFSSLTGILHALGLKIAIELEEQVAIPRLDRESGSCKL